MYKVRNVVEKKTKGGDPYYMVDTECGLTGAIFKPKDSDLPEMWVGQQFDADHEVKGKYSNFQNVVVNMSSPRPIGHTPDLPRDKVVSELDKQVSIERQNALTNYTKLVCEFPLWDDDTRVQMANSLCSFLEKRIGL